MAQPADPAQLLAALEGLAEQLRGLRFPLDTADSDEALRLRQEIADQLDDYLLPRLRRLDAPLLAVVGGPTGAGKSTLVNSLVGARISPASVLRPTTRAAVLAHSPRDGAWFESRRILPALERTPDENARDPEKLRLVASERVPDGLAILDAPDIDSVVTSNRDLAAQLLSAADMWLFVTTAARYADAVPWQFLRQAVERGTAVAMVLDRVAPESIDQVRDHLAEMLESQGLGRSPLFVVPETDAFGGLLPDEAIEPISTWLERLAADASARAAVVKYTLDGALSALSPRLVRLAEAADAQMEAMAQLNAAVDRAYDRAAKEIDDASSNGSLLRGEVMARWQEFVGTGEWMRALESKVGRLRDRVTAAVQGKPAPGAELAEALETGVEALVRSAADRAAAETADAWTSSPAGRALVAGDPALRRSSSSLAGETERAVRDWQGYVLNLVREQGQGKRRTARFLAFGVNGLGLMLMIAVFAHTGGLVAGEIAVAGSSAALAQKILEAVLGDQAVRALTESARTDLRRRVSALLASERARFAARLAAVEPDPDAGPDMRAAATELRRTWAAHS